MLEPRRQRGSAARPAAGASVSWRVLVGERGVGRRGWPRAAARAVSIARSSSWRARRERAQLELRLLRLRSSARLLVARRVERALGGDASPRRARPGAPGATPSSHVERVEARSRRCAASRRSSGELGVERGALAVELLAPLRCVCSASWRQAHAARPAGWCARDCSSRGFALARGEVRCAASVLAASARTRRAARLLADQRLRARLPLQVLDLLRAREQAGLLASRARRS